MEPITTDWHHGNPPLTDRPGEYETQVDETIARRWWDGERWSAPYSAEDSPEIITAARETKLEGVSVVWRGMVHRYAIGDKVRHDNIVCTVVAMRRGKNGWQYELTSARWVNSEWVREDLMRPAVMPGDAPA